MKSMKGLSMNKMLGSIKKKAGGTLNGTNGDSNAATSSAAASPADSPEGTAHNNVKAFCESGGNVKGDEVLFLPPIVDAAESSPTAAAECARLIRKFMSKDYNSRPAWQYNAIMLLRILADNPGATFTRNLDQKFVDTAKTLLKHTRDPSVRQILMEALDDFEFTKSYDDGLALIIQMWKKEKEKVMKDHVPVRHAPTLPQRPHMTSPPSNAHSQNYFSRHHNNRRLPDPAELSSRLEEARTSAKLLEQVVMNTPTNEMMDNDLIKEFADRCLSASRSIQGYMVSTDPAPDNDTMESLIDTNEQLQRALSQHQRAVLGARKQLGLGERPEDISPGSTYGQEPVNGSNGEPEWSIQGSEVPPASYAGNGKGKQTEAYNPPLGPPPGAKASGSGSGSGAEQNPFEDPFKDPFKDPQPGGANHSAVAPSAGPAGTTQPSSYRPLAGDVSDDDLYEATPKNKEPMHRY